MQKQRFYRMFLVLIGVVIATAVLVWTQGRENTSARAWSKAVPKDQTAVVERTSELVKAGNFEEAINLVEHSLKGTPSDDSLLQRLASIYFMRAQVDPSNRPKWVRTGLEYSTRALAANPSDIINVYNVGESQMTVAMNLQRPEACDSYRAALATFEKLRADKFLSGEYGQVEGERVQLAPYREKLDENIRLVMQAIKTCK